MFTNLSSVCRFFANVCLPRIFELLEFSGSIFHDDTPFWLGNDASYKASRESVLCAQIVAQQPLALALAKVVRVCHFADWRLDGEGSWAVRTFARKYISGMLHMENIRELRFTDSFVDIEHWDAIATLPSLEKLSFLSCLFLQGPADVEPEKRVKVKVSRLQVLHCNLGFRQALAAIDPQHLRVLDMDHKFLDQVNWRLLSSLIELRFYDPYGPFQGAEELFMQRLHAFLIQVPQSLEELRLAVDISGLPYILDGNMFDDPAWRNLSLRSLALVVESPGWDVFLNVSQTTFIEYFTVD